MQTIRGTLLFILIVSFALITLPILAQQVIATVPVGTGPGGEAINPVTNKIYVSNYNSGTVTIIDGSTLATTDVNVGTLPVAVAVNSSTNKIYVSIYYTNSVTVIDGATLSTTSISLNNPGIMTVDELRNKIYNVNQIDNTITVIDGATLSTSVVSVGLAPSSVAVNAATNKIYVPCYGSNSVTVVDGATLFTTAVATSQGPEAVVVDQVTNKIYVSSISGGVTVIDGATLSTTTVAAGGWAFAITVNPVTNKIYVPSATGNNVTIIDGVTLSTTTVPAGNWPFNIAVNSATNRIYVVNNRSNSVTVIDGSNNAIANLAVGNSPTPVVVGPANNRTYIGNVTDNTVSVIDGTPPTALQFVAVAPCRLIDTRLTGGPIQAGTFRNFPIPQEGGCNIPTTAAAYSLNVTVVPQGYLSYLTVWPTGQPQPSVSTLNSLDGRIKANAAIVPAGASGDVSVYATDTTNVILDIDGYFAPVSGSTLAFYTLSPCRVADTRKHTFPPGLGSPYLTGRQERPFPILNATACNIPSSAAAYSLNFTVVPHGPLGYLTVWSTGGSRPNVSTLNDIPGQNIANAAIVVAGASGEVSVYPTNDTDLVIDINGYFAPAVPGGLSLYGVRPCRVIDTRKVGGGQPFSGTLTPPVDVVDTGCGTSSLAQAYVFNATVVPQGALSYLTLWPDGTGQPLVSTLNAQDGSISSNMAIVSTTNGKVDAFAAGLTQLILDISSYFAP
jgi:YVTN family beta-propeller protein